MSQFKRAHAQLTLFDRSQAARDASKEYNSAELSPPSTQFALTFSQAIRFSGSRRNGRLRGAFMTWDVSFTCDICGKKKGGANHWWMVLLGDVPCFDEGQPGQRFTLLPWNAAESRNSDMYHLCGQGCAMAAMERFMTTGAIEIQEEQEEEIVPAAEAAG